jgi:uncharacterized protein (DUF58 family)
MSDEALQDRAARREVADLPYRVIWRALSQRPGAHRSRHAGPGGRFRDVVPFLAAPDPRRIDLRQSLRDPWGALYVRRFEQMASLDVVLLADVSGSMGFSGQSRKMAMIAELAEVLARSAHRVGDRFGLAACDNLVREELGIVLSRARGGEGEMADRIARFVPRAAAAKGLQDAAISLGGRQRLVVLVSDFRLPEADIAALLDVLAAHDVVPIVLDDSAEVEALPSWGLISLQDLETKRTRSILMRPALKARVIAEDRARRAVLKRLFAQSAREAVFICDRIDWHRLGAALLGAR